MFFAGLTFGIGLWLGSIVVIGVAIAVSMFVSSLRKRFGKRTDYPKVRRIKTGHLVWTKGPYSTHECDGSAEEFTFRSTIRWSRENPREPQKEIHSSH